MEYTVILGSASQKVVFEIENMEELEQLSKEAADFSRIYPAIITRDKIVERKQRLAAAENAGNLDLCAELEAEIERLQRKPTTVGITTAFRNLKKRQEIYTRAAGLGLN